MKLEKKETEVRFADEKVKKAYERLKQGKYESIELYRLISRAIDDLKKDPFCGICIHKRLIPAEYRKKYNVDSIWKYNLPSARS